MVRRTLEKHLDLALEPIIFTFARKFRKLVEGRFKRYGYFEYITEGEILRYQVSFTLLSFSPLNSENDSERNFVLASFDSVVYIHEAISAGKKVLVEGDNALMLDLDFGTYPYVIFSSTIIGGICIGLGASPKTIGFADGMHYSSWWRSIS